MAKNIVKALIRVDRRDWSSCSDNHLSTGRFSCWIQQQTYVWPGNLEQSRLIVAWSLKDGDLLLAKHIYIYIDTFKQHLHSNKLFTVGICLFVYSFRDQSDNILILVEM